MKLSIVTPSFNQGEYIERTIKSVLSQTGDFELEYIIIDGGSTDTTPDIVENYKDRLAWISEKDRGQSDAINKGFTMASGDIFAWLNSDDTYEPYALSEVVKTYEKVRFKWCIGNCRIIDKNDNEIRQMITKYKVLKCKKYSFEELLAGNFIPQPSVFFAKEVYRKAGPLSIDCLYAMDYDFWLRLGRRHEPYYINKFLANFRWHDESKCGEDYRKAALEAYALAKRYATAEDKYLIIRHYVHYKILCSLYPFL